MPDENGPQADAPEGARLTPLLRQQTYQLYLAGRFFSGIGQRMMTVVVGWHVYLITNDPIALGYVGLASFLPALGLTLITGEIADRYNRATILLLSSIGMAVSALGLTLLAATGVSVAWPLYVFIAFYGASQAFSRPALISLLPKIVPRAQFMDAIALSSSMSQASMIAGPAAAGLLLILGVTTGYVVITASMVLMALVWARLIPFGDVEAVGTVGGARATLQRVFAGIGFIRRTPIILAGISLDLIVVLFGSVVALLPVFAKDILEVGPAGLGALRAAPAAGAVLMALTLARFPIRRHAGAKMLAGTAIYGIATLVFGFSTSFILSLVALFITGAGDMVSVIVRNAIIQLQTPDSLRGRVNAVNMLFIAASNELGDFRAGVAAGLLGTIPAVLLGGVITIAATGANALFVPMLRKLDRVADLTPAPDPEKQGKTG